MQRLLGAILLLCLTNIATAQGNWYLSGKSGASFPKIDDKYNYVSTGADWPKDQYTNTDITSNALLGLEAGYRWSHQKLWLPFYSLGLNYTYVFPTTLKGTINQYSLAEFENYNYHYRVQRQTYLAIFKADLYRWCNFMPYLSAAAGVSLNTTSDYSEQALPDVTERVSPGFRRETNTRFSYAFGAGIDYAIKNNWWVSLGYEYGHQGTSHTGYGVNIPMLTDTNFSNDRLKSNLITNSVLFSVTYFFDSINNKKGAFA